jgi:hypothetical protein
MLPLLACCAVTAFGQEFTITASNVTYSGLNISNPNGICINIRPYVQNVRIVNSNIGPCGDAGIHISAFTTGVTIENNVIHDTRGNGIQAYQSQNIGVTGNRITNIQSGVYAQDVTGIRISQNQFLNALGPYPRGQFVQFNRVRGAGNRINCNVAENTPGVGAPEEGFNLFDSYGDASNPIIVEGNKMRNGGTGHGSGGIMLGDGGGAYQIARDNILVDSGQQGIGLSGGNNIQVLRNRIYARQQSFTNVGMYVWNQYSQPCYGHTIQDNTVDYTDKYGQKHGFWNGGNCSVINGLSLNNFNASLSADIFNSTAGSCPASNSSANSGTQYLSDLPYRVIANGWGPVEKDLSNGEAAARDGSQLRIGGVSFAKGLGVHANSDVRYTMNGRCSTFSARVGVDDEVGSNGSVIFRVYADGVKLFDSGTKTGSTGASTVSVGVSGKNELSLVVVPSATINYAHADWADATLTCQ